jgi:hypothetical protein
MKFKHNILLLTAAMVMGTVTLFFACKKPTEDFLYVINSSVFNYTASLRFQDPANNNTVPTGITAKVQGAIASSVYDLSGFQSLKISSDGIVTFGLTQSAEPIGTQDVAVTVLVQAPGYRDENVTIVFNTANANQPVRDVKLLSLTKPSDGVGIVTQTQPVSGSTITAPVSVSTPPPSSSTTQASTVAIPANTQLKDAAGNPVTTTTVNISVVNLDVEKPASLQFIPNSSLVQTAVINNVSQTVIFAPAGITTIEMTSANGTQITNFSQPINVTTTLDPTTVNPNNGTPIKAGDALDYYSYNATTNSWKYESSGVVTSTNGVLNTTIPITHLSSWMSVVKQLISLLCSQSSVNVSITGPYIPATNTDRYTFSFLSQTLNKVVNTITTVVDQDHKNIKLTGLPTGSIVVTVTGPAGTIVGTTTLNLCTGAGGTITVNIPQPNVDQPNLTLTITGVCSTGSTPKYGSNAPQGTVVQFRNTGTTPWLVLGSVDNTGSLTTNLLNKNNTYDFQAGFTAPDGTPLRPGKSAQNLTVVQAAGYPDFLFTQTGTNATLKFTYVVKAKYCQ